MGLIRCSCRSAGSQANRSPDIEGEMGRKGEGVEVVLEMRGREGFTSKRAWMIVDAERTRDLDCGLGVSHLESS